MPNEEPIYISQREQLKLALNARCEIRTITNQLVYFGRIQKVEDFTIFAHTQDGQLPPAIYGTEIKVIIRSGGMPTSVWSGLVRGSAPEFWKLELISSKPFSENRAYFRQPVLVQSRCVPVAPLLHSGQYNPKELPLAQFFQTLPLLDLDEALYQPCFVTDISLRGMQLRCAHTFERGDWVYLPEVVFPANPGNSFSFFAQICWADRAAQNEFTFGTRFDTLDETVEDDLCGVIFSLQRQDIQARR